MVSAREFALAMYGCWQFAKLDRSAVQFFDNTPEAFWKSFNAAIFAAPAYCLLILLNFADNPVDAGPVRIVFVEGITYAIGWVMFPLIMISFTDATGSGRNYWRFIAAWNWSIVLQVFVYLGVVAFSASGALPGGLGAFVSLIATVLILCYQGFIARVTLETPLGPAVSIVVIDLAVSIGLNFTGRWFYG